MSTRVCPLYDNTNYPPIPKSPPLSILNLPTLRYRPSLPPGQLGFITLPRHVVCLNKGCSLLNVK